jgi:ubiquinone/menaquinone biosynthesis C-methylase UbiE
MDDMAEGAKGTAADAYVLDTGDIGAARLRLLDEVYGGFTRRLLMEGGLKAGMRVLDMACGTGPVSCWMAGVVGFSGSVVGVDANPDQLVVARQNWEACEGLRPIEFLEASAYDTGLPAEEFDLVHCRFLLCHLTSPVEALKEMYRLLKPGGALVCQDIEGANTRAYPDSGAYGRALELMMQAEKLLGVNYNFGMALPNEAVKIGFRNVKVSYERPMYLVGEGKLMFELTFAEAVPVMVRLGIATEEELAELLKDMRELALDENVLLSSWGMPGIVAVK